MTKKTNEEQVQPEVATPAASKVTYTKEDKVKIKELKNRGIELTGQESSEELDTLLIDSEDEEDTKIAEQEVIDGVPNNLPIRQADLNAAGKIIKVPIFFMAMVKGGRQAMYGPTGQRLSPAFGPDDILPGSGEGANATNAVKYHAKMVASNNVRLMKNAELDARSKK